MLSVDSNNQICNLLIAKAVQYLAQRAHSEQELRQKLQLFLVRFELKKQNPKNFTDCHNVRLFSQIDANTSYHYSQQINKTVQYCHDHHWLDDSVYLQQYVNMRSTKGYGRLKIQVELQQKGIARILVDEFFNNNHLDWSDIAFKQLLKKYKLFSDTSNEYKAKVCRFLLSRGFLQDEIIEAFQRFKLN